MADEVTGLRERKKQRTHDALSEAAIRLFLDRGFDSVSVAEIAAAAEVSKPTLFTYFSSKEDLLLYRIADHHGEAARVVRERATGESPLGALERHFVEGLRRYDPVTGLNDDREVLAYHGMVFSVPSLLGRLAQHAARDEEALAVALAEAVPGVGEFLASLVAGHVVAAKRILSRENWRRVTTGRSAAQVLPEAIAIAQRAFRSLRQGFPELA